MIKNINTKFLILFILIVVSFLLRLISSYFYGDTKWEGEPTEWGILVHHLTNYNSYSLYRFGDLLAPSVYMPPGYPMLLYLLKIISFGAVNFIKLVIFFQIILSTYSVYIFYQLNLNLFSEKLSLINASIFSIFPLNIYLPSQVSSITLQFFLSLLFLQFLLLIIKKQIPKNIIFFSLISGLLILTRGEFVIVFFAIILFSLFYKNIKLINLLKIILIVSLVISPYVIRNYVHFNQLILVKSLGFNLWKGNNELSLVQGYEDYSNFEFQELKSKLDNIEQNKYYELNRDQIFLDEAKKQLTQNPAKYLYLFFKKLLAYYFIDLNSTYPKYYNFFHIFPVIILSILSLPGLFVFLKKKNANYNYLSLYLFLNLMIFSIFFILPRYKLIIFPIQIILAASFIKYILNKLYKKKL